MPKDFEKEFKKELKRCYSRLLHENLTYDTRNQLNYFLMRGIGLLGIDLDKVIDNSGEKTNA